MHGFQGMCKAMGSQEWNIAHVPEGPARSAGRTAPHPQLAALVARSGARVDPIISRGAGSAATDITRDENEAGEAALGNLIADAQRAAMGA